MSRHNKSRQDGIGVLFARTRPNARQVASVEHSSWIGSRTRSCCAQLWIMVNHDNFLHKFPPYLRLDSLPTGRHSQRFWTSSTRAPFAPIGGVCMVSEGSDSFLPKCCARSTALACITRGEKERSLAGFFDEHLASGMPVDFGQNSLPSVRINALVWTQS